MLLSFILLLFLFFVKTIIAVKFICAGVAFIFTLLVTAEPCPGINNVCHRFLVPSIYIRDKSNLVFCGYIVVNNDWITNEYLYLIPFDGDDFYKYYIIAIIVLNLAIAYFTEAVIVPFFKKKWNDRQLRKMAKKISKAESEYNLNMINEVKNFAKENAKKNSKEPSETESMKNE